MSPYSAEYIEGNLYHTSIHKPTYYISINEIYDKYHTFQNISSITYATPIFYCQKPNQMLVLLQWRQ